MHIPSVGEVLRHNIALCKYAVTLAGLHRQAVDAPKGTDQHAAAWLARTRYAAWNHPDHPSAWKTPGSPEFGEVPDGEPERVAGLAAALAAWDTAGHPIKEIEGVGPESPGFVQVVAEYQPEWLVGGPDREAETA